MLTHVYLQGLRAIKAVIDLKGQKRFKQMQGLDAINQKFDDLHEMDIEDAKKMLRKINNTTSYDKTFGEKPKAQEDFQILRQKPFRELPIATIIKPQVCEYLTNFLKIND